MEDPPLREGALDAHDDSRGVVTAFLALDEIDSPRGGCTTHAAAFLARLLIEKYRATFVDYPRLVRLNPDIPWKTRGNGAIAFKIAVPRDSVDELLRDSAAFIDNYTAFSGAQNSGVVLYASSEPPEEVKEFSKLALSSVLSIGEARKLIRKYGILEWHKGNGRGLIGALAAIGNELLDDDYTFELLAYRKEENFGTPRRIDPESVLLMDREFAGRTFNNVDPETGRILVTPHGPDPVLFGVRGEEPSDVIEAARRLVVLEEVECCMLFVTNQGTDQHLVPKKISELRPYDQACVSGTVSTRPTYITGGHTFFKLADESGEILCAVYEPTGKVAKFAKRLTVGDEVTVCGGVKPKNGRVLNVQKIVIDVLQPRIVQTSPRCVGCLRPLKSLGKGKGYFCPRCRFHLPAPVKCRYAVSRDLPRILLPPPRSQRHLTKPLARYGREKRGRSITKPIGPLFWGDAIWRTRQRPS